MKSSRVMLLFGSELKAHKAHPAFRAEIDRDALTLFLRHREGKDSCYDQ